MARDDDPTEEDYAAIPDDVIKDIVRRSMSETHEFVSRVHNPNAVPFEITFLSHCALPECQEHIQSPIHRTGVVHLFLGGTLKPKCDQCGRTLRECNEKDGMTDDPENATCSE